MIEKLKLLYHKNEQLLKFVIAGCSGAVAEFSFFVILTQLFNIYFLRANIIAVFCATFINYFVTKKMEVFEEGKYRKRVEIPLFILISIGSFFLNQFLLHCFVKYWGWNPLVSKALSIAIVAFVNFFSKKKIVFQG
jgi:putative flippase GtrA